MGKFGKTFPLIEVFFKNVRIDIHELKLKYWYVDYKSFCLFFEAPKNKILKFRYKNIHQYAEHFLWVYNRLFKPDI